MKSTDDEVPLRRNGFTFLLVHGNVLPVFVTVFFLVAGFVNSQTPVVIMGLLAAVISCSPFLLAAKVSATHLDFGYRWNRKHVALGDISGVRIGKALRFGMRSGDAKGMRLALRNGDVLLVDESQYCTRGRLAKWAEVLVARAPSIEVEFGEIPHIEEWRCRTSPQQRPE